MGTNLNKKLIVIDAKLGEIKTGTTKLLKEAEECFKEIDKQATNDQARVLEQALMMAFGTIGIFNKINSIAQKNWDAVKFAEEVQRLKTLLSSITCSD